MARLTPEARRVKELRKLINAYNTAYYDRDEPLVSDAAYDACTRELRELEARFPELDTNTSPTHRVNGQANAGFHKIQHLAQLQSLRDVFNFSDVSDWYGPVSSETVTVEDKVDGLSLAVTYKDGLFDSAATRGDGFTGEDVTANVSAMDSVPKQLPGAARRSIVIVRCEVYMPFAVFERLNQEQERLGKPLFKNVRNAAAGSLRVSDPDITRRRGLRAIAFNVLYADGQPDIRRTQSGDLAWLKAQGFDVITHYICSGMKQIYDAILSIDENRGGLPYAIDGAVVKIDSMAQQKTLGAASKYPHWAVAYKYPPEQKQTVLRSVVLQTGRTGAITPVAVFDPVQLAGTTVTRATLHNMGFVKANLGGVAIGDEIIVHKSGEIIPEVLAVAKRNGGPKAAITHCPVCGSPATLRTDENGCGTQHYCVNPDCPAILERHLIYWCGKHVMDITGMGPQAIKTLIDAGLVLHSYDIYGLTDAQMTELFGQTLGSKMYAAIQTSKTRNIDRLIAGLGIPGVGRSIGETLAAKYKTMDDIMSAALNDDLAVLPGIGKITADSIKAFMSDEHTVQFMRRLKSYGLNWNSLTFQTDNNSGLQPLADWTFVITGTLKGMTREQAASRIKANGGTVSGTVSRNTTYLLAGENAGSKLAKAQALGIPVIGLAELEQLIQSEA